MVTEKKSVKKMPIKKSVKTSANKLEKKPRVATKINYVVLDKPEKIAAFHVKDSDGHEFTEKSLLKQWTVLYFYPKDMTSGCTVEAQDFQKNLKKFILVKLSKINFPCFKLHNIFYYKITYFTKITRIIMLLNL